MRFIMALILLMIVFNARPREQTVDAPAAAD